MKVVLTRLFFSPDGNINIACCLVSMYTSILYIEYYLQGFSFDSYTLFDENTFIKNIEVECATILRKNPRLRLLKGIIFCVLKITCVLKIQNGKVIRYDVIFSAFNQQRSKNIQPEPGKKTMFVYMYTKTECNSYIYSSYPSHILPS